MSLKRIIVFVIVLVLMTGCGKRAEPIDVPSSDAVTNIEVVTIAGTKIDIPETDHIARIINALNTAEPTGKESVNDQPTNVNAYGTVSINTDGEPTVLFYYDKDGKHYLEKPYIGIYSVEDSLEDILLQ